MKASLLAYLRCTECQKPFQLEEAKYDGADIDSGRLQCLSCRVSYEIRGGVPRFIPAQIEAAKQKTAVRFGDEWEYFDQINSAFEKDLLKEFILPATPDVFKGALVLELGCGAGRNILKAAEYGAATVIGVDISSSVNVAYRKTRDTSHIHVIQADIYKIPLVQNFDVVFSAGVLHHLPNPERGYNTAYRHTRPGGLLLHTVYGKENNEWIAKYLDPFRLSVTTKMNPFVLRVLSLLMTCAVYPLIWLVYKPVNSIGFLKPLSSRLFYNDFAYLMVRLGFRATWLQIYDQLTAPVAHLISLDEIKGWIARLGLENPRFFWRNKNCWNFVVTR